jgi:hypothetical protein
MTLNDGGVDYLVANLTPVCRAAIKAGQIAAQLRETAATLARELKGFHVSDDLHQRLEERRAAAQALVGELVGVYERRLFGALLDALCVRPGEVADAIRRPPPEVRFVASRGGATTGAFAASGIVRPGGAAPGGDKPSVGPAGLVLPGGARPAAATSATSAAGVDRIRTTTRAEWRAEAAFALWVARLRAFAGDEGTPLRLSLSAEGASELAGELVAAARRLDLQGSIVRALEEAAFLERGDQGAIAGATIAAELLNRFAAEAGASLIQLEARPDIAGEGGALKPFAPRPQVDGLERLPADPRRADAAYLTSWLHMIYALFEQNALAGSDGAVDPAQNARLGRLLKTFAAA